MKHSLFKLVWFVIFGMLVSGLPLSASAQLTPGFSIHGFGGWAYGQTNNENRYLVGDQDGSYNYVNFTLNINAIVSERLRFQFQSSFTEGFEANSVDLDYAFAEYYLSEKLIFRIGQIKAPHMLYTEIYDVGTLRPFFSLPQGLYHDFAAESYKGIGLTGNLITIRSFEIMYDLYAGKIDFLPYRVQVSTSYEQEGVEYEQYMFASLEQEAREVLGGRLVFNTPVPGLSFQVSVFSGLIDYRLTSNSIVLEDGSHGRYTFTGFSFEYVSDTWWIRSEQLENSEEETHFNTGYTEIAYKLTNRFQVAVRYEFEFEEEEGEVESDDIRGLDFSKHTDAALGLNYWFNQNLVLKCSCHWVTGNRFANPEKLESYILDSITDSGDQETTLFLIGAQFSF